MFCHNEFDFGFVFVGIVMGMTIPVIYEKYEGNIRRLKEGVKKQLRRYHDMFDEKVIKKVTSKVGSTTSTTSPTQEEKEKKVE